MTIDFVPQNFLNFAYTFDQKQHCKDVVAKWFLKHLKILCSSNAS